MTQLGFDSGLLSVLNCYSLNLRYNAVLWQMVRTAYLEMHVHCAFSGFRVDAFGVQL